MSIIAILTDGGVGGTFLSWSVHYLAGHKQYFNTKTNSWCEVVANPLTSSNAHEFHPNQPITYNEFNTCLSILETIKSENFHTIYFHPFRESVSGTFVETQQSVTEIISVAKKIIILTNQPKNSLYHKSFRQRVLTQKFLNPLEKNLSNKEQLDDFVNCYFKENIDIWNNLKLTEIWDLREFLALNLRKDEYSIAPLIDRSIEHFDVDCLEWINTADIMIPALFKYLEVEIDADKFLQWKQIYQSWRKVHYNRLNFLWCFDKIIDYILKGYYMDLERLDLDIVQEAFLQHELIYKYNLNLKTFQLAKFSNTKQLNQLLEPNIHTLNTTI
jgi:hypothetical protein